MPPQPVNPGELATAFLVESVRVHERIERGIRLGHELIETTITQEFILDLRETLGDRLEIIPHSQQAEGTTGADWRWRFAIEGDRFWYVMLIQAKRLKSISAAAGHGYDLGYSNASGRQLDHLRQSADAEGAQALYALYNGPQLIADPWSCGNLPQHQPLMGVGILTADAAAWLINLNAGASMVPQSIVTEHAAPLPCLAMCHWWAGCGNVSWPWDPPDFGFPDGDPNDLARRVAMSVAFLEHRATFRQVARSGLQEPSVAGVHADLPEGVRAALEGDPESLSDSEAVATIVLRRGQ